MPNSALIQLVAKGQQDAYLSLNPDMSYFKYMYKRHTNFSMESLKLRFDGKSPTLKNTSDTCRIKIDRHGDLLGDLWFVYTIPEVYSNKDLRFRWVKNFATLMVREANVYAGSLGRPISTIYGEWMVVWNELTLPANERDNYDKLTANIKDFLNPTKPEGNIKVSSNNQIFYEYYPAGTNGNPSIPSRTVAIPLKFNFTRSTMSYLPLCALQTSEVYVSIEIESIENLYQVYDSNLRQYVSPTYYNQMNGTNINIDTFVRNKDINPYIECNYIYLDENERRLIILNRRNNQILLENVYKKDTQLKNNAVNIDLNLNNPVKEIIWTMRRGDWKNYNTMTNYTKNNYEIGEVHILKNAKLLWNKSNERVEEKDPIFYGLIQPYQHHSNIPKTGIYCYSFAIKPQDWRPSGYFNPSSKYPINTSLYLEVDEHPEFNYDITLYAITYNVLEIIGGQAGLKFA